MMAFDDVAGNHTGNHTHYHPTVLTKCALLPRPHAVCTDGVAHLHVQGSPVQGSTHI